MYSQQPIASCYEPESYPRLIERERERVLHLSSLTGLIQVLPGHPLADPKDETVSS